MQLHSQRQLEILRLMEVDVWRLRPDIHPSGYPDQGTISASSGMVGENQAVVQDLHEPSTALEGQPAIQPRALVTRWSATAECSDACDWVFVCQTGNDDLSPSTSAGRLYDSLLFALGLNRTEVSTVCSWAAEEEPTEHNLENVLNSCLVEHTPKIIVVLGGDCARALLRSDQDVKALRNKQYRYQGDRCQLMVTHGMDWLLTHPEDKAETWHDLVKAQAIVRG